MNNLKQIIKQLVPLGIIKRRNDSDFLCQYDKWLQLDKEVVWDDTCKASHIVSVQGFGYSGSGAVVDLLREYECCNVVGYVSPIGSLTSRKEDKGEVNIMRRTGGLLQLSQLYDEANPSSIFWDDAMMKTFIRQCGYDGLTRNENIKEIYFAFIKEITELRIKNIDGFPYNGFLSRYDDTSEIFHLRRMSKGEFINLCRLFLNTLFNQLTKEDGQLLILDQMLADCGYNQTILKQYIPNIKQIAVYRDPRDIYALAHSLNVSWIAHDSTDRFVKWFKSCYRGFATEMSDILTVGFENLVNNYDHEVSRIEKDLGIDSGCHTNCFKCFNPQISAQGVGQWRRSAIPNGDFEKIKEELSDYCYER